VTTTKTDPGETFAVDVTDGVRAVLRAAVETTRGPGNALAAVTMALAALQQYMQRCTGPNATEYIGAINEAAVQLPADMGVSLVNFAIDDVRAAAAQAEAPTRFYGEA